MMRIMIRTNEMTKTYYVIKLDSYYYGRYSNSFGQSMNNEYDSFETAAQAQDIINNKCLPKMSKVYKIDITESEVWRQE